MVAPWLATSGDNVCNDNAQQGLQAPDMKPVKSEAGEEGGVITGLSLTSVLQILALERKDFTVEVSTNAGNGHIYFLDGDLVDATFRGRTGMSAMQIMLSWPEPSMRIIPGRVQRQRTIRLPLIHALLEISQRTDEMEAQDHHDPGADAGPAQPPPNRLESGEIIGHLLGIPEVLHASVLDRFGRILAQSSKTIRFQEPLKHAALAGEAMRAVLDEQLPEFVTLEADGGEALMLVFGPDNIAGLYLKKMIEPREITTRVRNLLTPVPPGNNHG